MIIEEENKSDISFVLPSYNERNNILPLLDELLELSDIYELELIVIDDNSTDGKSLDGLIVTSSWDWSSSLSYNQ